MGSRKRLRAWAVGLGSAAIGLAAVTTAGGALAATPTIRPASPVIVSPEPGTPDASPDTQISILGAAPRKIESVSVTGSLSGPHPGTLRAYSADRGASFVLRRPLTQGERVGVRIRISGRRAIGFSFTVARLAQAPPIITATKAQPAKLQRFASEPTLMPPRIEVSKADRGLKDDLFLTPLPSPIVHPGSDNAISIDPVGPAGPMIIDPRGRLVWFHQLAPPLAAANFRPQRLNGRTVLTWWQGKVTIAAYGLGEGVIYSTNYKPIETVRTGNGYAADLHEFLLTPSGDALFTIQSLILVHQPGTPAGTLSPLLDSIVQEVDIRTGLVVWEWHAYGHIPLADSYATRANSPYLDAYHVNSIQSLPGERVLISARDTSAIYEIDRASGRILWTLGGKASSFRMGRGSRFYFQHDARLLSGDRVSLFDDEGGPPYKAAASRGLILGLDPRRHTARVLHQYHRPGPTLADSEGSFRTLAGGDALVGFGSERYFSIFSPWGRLLFDASLPVDDGSYRVFGAPWTATPSTRPALSAHRGPAEQVTISASWNGATTVARWQVLAGPVASALRPVASAPARGFETRINLTSAAGTFAVRALGRRGQILASSAPVKPS
ncbi:MAG TPA: arylsulfotransferase family protein [Solirubrobacteraceae bacterium]|nr:arylsulfotransferase family protein [Solirubrobacteraceae bacterium]